MVKKLNTILLLVLLTTTGIWSYFYFQPDEQFHPAVLKYLKEQQRVLTNETRGMENRLRRYLPDAYAELNDDPIYEFLEVVVETSEETVEAAPMVWKPTELFKEGRFQLGNRIGGVWYNLKSEGEQIELLLKSRDVWQSANEWRRFEAALLKWFYTKNVFLTKTLDILPVPVEPHFAIGHYPGLDNMPGVSVWPTWMGDFGEFTAEIQGDTLSARKLLAYEKVLTEPGKFSLPVKLSILHQRADVDREFELNVEYEVSHEE